MKTNIAFALALLALVPAQAQVFGPESVGGVVLGGIAGAIIGNNSGSLHHNAWQGAAIGAGAGLLFGSALGDSRYQNAWANTQVTMPGAYVYRDSPYYYAGGRGYAYDRPDYAATGTLLGGIAGAIIGNNSHGHNAWRGAAIGAGAGYLFGSSCGRPDRNHEPGSGGGGSRSAECHRHQQLLRQQRPGAHGPGQRALRPLAAALPRQTPKLTNFKNFVLRLPCFRFFWPLEFWLLRFSSTNTNEYHPPFPCARRRRRDVGVFRRLCL
jgi:hypothetical protein